MNNKISCSHLLSSLTVHNFVAIGQWRSQNIVVARAQVGQHIRCCAMREKLACGGMPPRKILGFRTSEIASAGFSGQVHVSVAKIIHMSSIQEALSLLFSLFLLSNAC